ncbi:MAG: toprim domain-containing protein [Nitrososphaeria archaeon]
MPRIGSDVPRPFRGGVHSKSKFSRKKVAMIEKIQELVKALNNEIKDNAMLVVEGPNDASALEALGVIGKPFLYSHNSDHVKLFNLAKSSSKVIILVDNDKEGWSICKKLMISFDEKNIKYDIWYRKEFFKVGKGQTLHLEDFPSLIKPYL